MGNCNMECCRYIDKKETQINQISNKPSYAKNYYKNRMNQIKPSHLPKLLIQKNNRDEENKTQQNNSIHFIEDGMNTRRKIFNENTKSDFSYREISLKFSKKTTLDRSYSPNTRYEHLSDTLKSDKNKDNEKLNEKNNYRPDEDLVIINRRSPDIMPRYFHNYNTLKNKTNKKNLEKLEEFSKDLDLTGNYQSYRLSNMFPIKYNYHKDKYITYFTDDNI